MGSRSEALTRTKQKSKKATAAAEEEATAAMESFNKFIGREQKEPEWWEELNKNCTLSKTTRFYGFGICFCLGALCTFMSSIFLWQILKHPAKFAITYTVGNIISLLSTGFVIGPCKQVKNMFKPVRVAATLIYFCSMALTLVFAIKFQSVAGVIVCCIVQFCALAWYCLSYIPYGRQLAMRCCGGIVGV